MSTKMRIRDLVAELGAQGREIMRIVHELGIEAKTQMSGLTEEQVEAVRKRYEASQNAPVETRVAGEVVVRRRRRTTRSSAPKDDREGEASAPAAKEAPQASEDSETTPQKSVRKARRPEAPRARIIETPQPEVQPEPQPASETAPAAPEATLPQEEATPEASVPVQDTPEDAMVAAPEASADGRRPAGAPQPEEREDASSKDGRKRAKDRGRKPQAPTVAVKVISRPKVVEFPQASPRPEPRPAPAPAAPPSDAPSRDSRGKKKKGRRTVEARDIYDKQEAAILSKSKKAQRAEARRQSERRPVSQPIKAAKRKIRIEESIRLSDLAHQMGLKAQELIKTLFGMGVLATINQSLDFETAALVAAEFHYDVEKVGFSEESFLIPQEADAPESLKPRPPVVTIMGHVDHGKTSLLDAIRQTNVASGEAGGITQHIGAYHVRTPRGEVVFLDTPGHEAFTTMRARGAQVTDIVVLVVAADDGVMEQTREAINHARAAGVPIVVAVNKIDKPGADPDRVKRELADLGLLAEDWGGDTIFAPVSAKKRIGLDELLELILLQAEVLELKANPDKPGRGHVIEARLDKGRGPVATILVKEGQIRQGDAFVCGLFSGKVRAMFNDQGRAIKVAGPSMPAELQGLEGVPEAGDEFVVVQDEKVARRIAEERRMKQRERELAKESKVTLESFLAAKAGGETQSLNIVLKADVQGSQEAIAEALRKLSTDEIKIGIVHAGTGAISESDILLASASNAIVIGFNVRPTAKIKEIAEQEQVDIRFYDIIYKLVDDIKAAMSGMLSPEIKEVYLGQADVQQTFSVPKVGMVAGCMVSDGKMKRNAGARLLRDGVVVYTGRIASLKRFKEDAREVTKGYECGIGLENFNDIKVGDVIEAFEQVEEARAIE
jgi:translation initiation factor IF-2